ncbi:hypothetical protein HWV62_45671 [Athelia sp. TMB]|nr:hypothetical protein HWV62_45671 [Athelia sp. TMB]
MKALGPNAIARATAHSTTLTPYSFAALSTTLEAVGLSAYTGAAQYITSNPYLRPHRCSIRALHRGHHTSLNQPLRRSLDLQSVCSLTTPFLTPYPELTSLVKPFAALRQPHTSSASAEPKVALSFKKGKPTSKLYAGFYIGMGTKFAKTSSNKEITIPKDLIVTVYAVHTANGIMLRTANTAGAVGLDF